MSGLSDRNLPIDNIGDADLREILQKSFEKEEFGIDFVA